MEYARSGYWWVPVVVGLLFIATTVVGFLGPSEAARNPYNYLELYAETPDPEIAQCWIDLALGIFGVFALAVIEMAIPGERRFRAVQSPLHFVVFFVAASGFLLTAITAIRTMNWVSDMAHYYYAQDGSMSDAAALIANTLPIDRDQSILLLGSGSYCLVLCVECLRSRRLSPLVHTSGFILGGLLLSVFFMSSFTSGTPGDLLGLAVTAVASPLFFMAIGFQFRRRSSHVSKVRSDSVCVGPNNGRRGVWPGGQPNLRRRRERKDQSDHRRRPGYRRALQGRRRWADAAGRPELTRTRDSGNHDDLWLIDPLVCPKCGWEMRAISVIQDPVEIHDILAHLVKTGRAPPGFDPSLLN